MSTTSIDLDSHLDSPESLVCLTPADAARVGRVAVEQFRLRAAQRLLARQAARIPAVGELLGDRDPARFRDLADFVTVLYGPDEYKSYDPELIDDGDFPGLTRWLDRLTAQDLSGIDMSGCVSLTEWCRRLEHQADVFVCHSSGTSGVLSMVPRSRRDRDTAVDDVVHRCRPLFRPFETNDVTYFALGPRRHYRITQSLCDGLEHRHHCPPVQLFDLFHGPEFHIAQGRMRVAAARGTSTECLRDPLVMAHRAEVEDYHRRLPELTRIWTENLTRNFRGRRIYFQGSFDKAWQITRQFEEADITGAFAPDSVFALAGGVKDGTSLPHDWQDRFRRATGVAPGNLHTLWGMSEVTGGVPRCSHGGYHFPLTMIPFQLEPGTRTPLPRNGRRTGQLALLELNSVDCWGGLISGDLGTIEWDSPCACGIDGPWLDADSVRRL